MPTSLNSIRDLAAVVRGRRADLGLSQAELARRARVSRQWVNEFEGGKSTAELGLVLRVLDALDLRLAIDERRGDTPPTQPAVDLDAILDAHRDR